MASAVTFFFFSVLATVLKNAGRIHANTTTIVSHYYELTLRVKAQFVLPW